MQTSTKDLSRTFHIAKLLNELKGKKEWKWEKEHQKAFEELKKKDYKLTYTCFFKKGRKIPSEN